MLGGGINDKNLHRRLKEMRELLPNVNVIKIIGNNTAGHPLYKKTNLVPQKYGW